jgi:protein TonB
MSSQQESPLHRAEQLELELTPEPIIAPATGSLVLHGLLFGGLVLYGALGGLFHHSDWGNAGSGGAIQASLVTSVLPLPSDQPLNQNVLTTETPSQAPAPPEPKAKQAEDENALAIADKKAKTKKDEKASPKTQQHQPLPKQDNLAQFGEQAGSSMPRATQAQNAANGPTSISEGDFGSRFGYYVDGINRKMASSSYRQEVDPHTPKGARAYIQFAIHRDGSISNVQISQPSGSTTLDRACMRAAQRVDTFGQLPAQYNQSTVMTSYYCEY